MLPLVLVLALAAPKPVPSASSPVVPHVPHVPRRLEHRSITVTDSTRQVEVHIATGSAVTITFPVDVQGAMMADPQHYLGEEPRWESRVLILQSRNDVPAGREVTVTVALADGTLLPPFVLSTVPGVADQTLEVAVELQKRASSDSAASLRLQLAEVQGRLDACTEQARGIGAMKMAELVLGQDFTKPATFVVEHHSLRTRDVQSTLYVETRVLYRLFDLTYLLITVENRDPDKPWVLDSAEVSVEGGGNTVEARVVHIVKEFEKLAPGVEEKVVIVFETPSQTANQLFTLKLRETGGPRHIELKGLKL